jgi:hypothetical protein
MNKLIIICSSIVIIASSIICAYIQYGIPVHIDLQYPAVIYRVSDKAIFQKTKIEIHLKKYKVWNDSPKYIGNIRVDAYTFTKNSEMMPVRFIFYNNTGGILTYITWLTNKGGVTGSAQNCLGSIWKVSNFEKVTILVSEPTDHPNQQQSKDLYIAAPANSREEAVNITKACGSFNKVHFFK